MVFQMPLHHPLRLAQDTALIDQLSRGRFDFAIGYGTRLGEFQPWNLDFTRTPRDGHRGHGDRPQGLDRSQILV